jgi:thymidylate kinase
MSSEAPPATRPLIVEFIGIPGAGKTTLARELVEILRERGIAAATVVDAARRGVSRTYLGRAAARAAPRSLRSGLLWQVFYVLGALNAVAFARERLRLVRTVLGGQLRRPIPAGTKRHIVFWFLQLGGRYRLLTATGLAGEAVVIDDGFLHRCVHLSASHIEAPEPAWVRTYVDQLPKPDLVIHPAADQALCVRRVLERGVWPHSRHLSRAELDSYLTNAGRAVELAVERVRERGWRVLTVDNGGRSLDEVRYDLTRALDPLLTAVDRESLV